MHKAITKNKDNLSYKKDIIGKLQKIELKKMFSD